MGLLLVGYVTVGLLVAAAGLLLAGAAYAAHTITRPRRGQPPPARAGGAAIEDVTFRTADGLTLHGWYLPHPAARDALVLAHGFRMRRADLLILARRLRARGHAVLLFDLRAHGASEGGRSTLGYHEARDIAAAARFLHARPGLEGRAVGVLGFSMGAVAALLAAAEEPLIAAVVADSAYAALGAIAGGAIQQLYRIPPFPLAPLIVRCCEVLTRSRIGRNRAVDAVARLTDCPVLLIHGARDTLVPVADAHALYAAAAGPKTLWIVPTGEHVRSCVAEPGEYLARLDRFFAAALAGAPPTAAFVDARPVAV